MIDYQLKEQLKLARQQAGWSLSKAAEMTGVSKAMLGQIERGESSPTVATLWKIAKGFHLPLSYFVDGSLAVSGDEKVRGNHRPVSLHEKDFKAKTLLPFDPRFGFEMFLIELSPGMTHLSEAHDHSVTEHVIVVQGIMEVKLGKRWKKINTNEVLRFAGNQPHGYRNTTESVAVFHNLIHYK